MQKYAVIIDCKHPLAGSTAAIERFTESGAEASIIQEDLSAKEVTLAPEQYETVTHLVNDFWLKVGDRVHHIKDADFVGEVIYIDFNLILAGKDVTTCLVLWDGEDVDAADIQWTNKLVLA